jgi:hypothetical protein
MNDRVVVYDKHGIGIHGSVRCLIETVFAGERLVAIGIETVRFVPRAYPSFLACNIES